MTEFEQSVHDDSQLWGMGLKEGKTLEALRETKFDFETVYKAYWKSYINSCTMCFGNNGMEMPHEEDLSYTYYPNADEYNSRYGW